MFFIRWLSPSKEKLTQICSDRSTTLPKLQGKFNLSLATEFDPSLKEDTPVNSHKPRPNPGWSAQDKNEPSICSVRSDSCCFLSLRKFPPETRNEQRGSLLHHTERPLNCMPSDKTHTGTAPSFNLMFRTKKSPPNIRKEFATRHYNLGWFFPLFFQVVVSTPGIVILSQFSRPWMTTLVPLPECGTVSYAYIFRMPCCHVRNPQYSERLPEFLSVSRTCRLLMCNVLHIVVISRFVSEGHLDHQSGGHIGTDPHNHPLSPIVIPN